MMIFNLAVGLILVTVFSTVTAGTVFTTIVEASQSKISPAGEDYFGRPGPWDSKYLDSLFVANKNWRKRMLVKDPKYFEMNEKGHFPKILWIGCSDARVHANEIIGTKHGDVFVHRNIANMVVSTDFNCMSAIQYAVDVLKVKHIIVCGHYDCGGVKAALTNKDHQSPLENWLRNIRDTYRFYRNEIDGLTELKARQRRLVELNVVEQCLNVHKSAAVQRRRIQTQSEQTEFAEPQVHALVYDPTTGEVIRLPVDFDASFNDLGHVYDLYRA